MIKFKGSFFLLAGRVLLVVAAALAGDMCTHAQTLTENDLPEAPLAHQQSTSAPSQSQQAQPQSQQAGQASSSSQSPPAGDTNDQQQRAADQLKKEEQQRILGVVPMFNVISGSAAPLTPHQKFQLFFKSSTDPWVFLLTAIDGGIGQAEDSFPAYGQGVEGYAKYWGASYADTFDGNFWGNAVLPSWWHEDPRYFRLGQGSTVRRTLYAASTTVWCKRDNGRRGPNYANVIGNFIGGAISNLYYPSAQRGVGLTLERGATVTYEGTAGAELAEFWPDIAQHYIRKRREKLAAQQAQQAAGTQSPSQTAQPASPQTQQPNPH